MSKKIFLKRKNIGKIMNFALSVVLTGSMLCSSTIPSYAAVRDNVGGMDTSVDINDSDTLGNKPTNGNASANTILKGYGAWVDGDLVVGTIPSLGTKTYTPGTTNQTITSGQYLSGTQTIKGDSNLKSDNIKAGTSIFGITGKSSVVDTADATAAAANMLSGKTAYVNGAKITGTISSLGAKTYTPGTTNQTITSGKYLSGTQTIKGDSNLIAANIVSGKKIFGVTGTAVVEKNSSAHSVPSGKTAATAAQVLSGKYVWNGSSWVEGSMTNKAGSTTFATGISESSDKTKALIKIPASGYYDTNATLEVPIETIKNNVTSLNSSFVISFPGETVGTTTTTTTHSKTATISLSWQGVLYLKCAYYGDYPGFETTSVLVNGTSMQKISSVSSSNKYDVWQLNMNGSSTITINYILCTNGYNTSGVTFTISGSQP